MSSLIFLQHVDPGAPNAPKSVPNVKKLSLSEFLVCSVCQKLGVYRHLPIKAQPYFLPSKRAGGKQSDRRRVWHFYGSGSIFRVNVATLKGVAFGISRTITKRLDLTSGSSLGFRLRPQNRRDPSPNRAPKKKRAFSAPLVRKQGV